MIKIKVEGTAAKIAAQLATTALRNAGLKVDCWTGVTPGEVKKCRTNATREKADVSIVAMSR